jgi:hypothetical protein
MIHPIIDVPLDQSKPCVSGAKMALYSEHLRRISQVVVELTEAAD